MTIDELLTSAQNDSAAPATLSPELVSLWHTKRNEWEAAHDIAQDINTDMGSWIHALLHLIEGDIGNAGYWFNRANRPVRKSHEIDELWTEIATALLQLP